MGSSQRYGSGNRTRPSRKDWGGWRHFDSNRDGRLSSSEYRTMVRFLEELETWWRNGRRGSPPKLPR